MGELGTTERSEMEYKQNQRSIKSTFRNRWVDTCRKMQNWIPEHVTPKGIRQSGRRIKRIIPPEYFNLDRTHQKNQKLITSAWSSQKEMQKDSKSESYVFASFADHPQFCTQEAHKIDQPLGTNRFVSRLTDHTPHMAFLTKNEMAIKRTPLQNITLLRINILRLH